MPEGSVVSRVGRRKDIQHAPCDDEVNSSTATDGAMTCVCVCVCVCVCLLCHSKLPFFFFFFSFPSSWVAEIAYM